MTCKVVEWCRTKATVLAFVEGKLDGSFRLNDVIGVEVSSMRIFSGLLWEGSRELWKWMSQSASICKSAQQM